MSFLKRILRKKLLELVLGTCYGAIVIIIVVELTWGAIYIEFRNMPAFEEIQWSEPTQQIVTVDNHHPLRSRYYVWARVLENRGSNATSSATITETLNVWLEGEGWEQDRNSFYSCDQLAQNGVLSGDQVSWSTFKPRGWGVEDKWSGVICVGIQNGNGADWGSIILATVTLSFWTDVYFRL